MTETKKELAEKNYKKMTETPVPKLILMLGIPTTLSMLITNIYNMADTYFVGFLGESAQGATGILFTLQAIIQAIAFMLGHGSGSFVSKELADKRSDRASVYVSTAFFVGGFFGLILCFIGLVFLTPFMKLLGSTDTILPYAKDYGFWVLTSAPFVVCSIVLNNNLRYEGKAFYAMFGLISGGILNILLDYIFIMKLELGVYGAGMATAISQVVSFIILFIMFKKMAQSSISIKYVAKEFVVYTGIVRVGLPSLIRQGLSSISNGLLNNLTKPYGDGAIAAMSIVLRYSSLVMCVGLGIGQGFQPLAAFNFEVKKYDRVKKGLVFTSLLGFIIVGVFSTLGAIFAGPIIRIFQSAESVVAVGKTALLYASFGLLFLPWSVPVNMLYQSIRMSKTASFLALMRSGLVLIPVLLILTACFGLTGIQLAQPVSDCITALVTLPFAIKFLKKY